MKNTRRSGQRIERLAEKELSSDGWIVQRAPPSYRWNKQTDLFGGLFDIMAIKQISRTPVYQMEVGIKTDKILYYLNHITRRYIQIKTNRKPIKKEAEKLILFKETYTDSNDFVEWWTWWSRGKNKKKFGWEKIII